MVALDDVVVLDKEVAAVHAQYPCALDSGLGLEVVRFVHAHGGCALSGPLVHVLVVLMSGIEGKLLGIGDGFSSDGIALFMEARSGESEGVHSTNVRGTSRGACPS